LILYLLSYLLLNLEFIYYIRAANKKFPGGKNIGFFYRGFPPNPRSYCVRKSPDPLKTSSQNALPKRPPKTPSQNILPKRPLKTSSQNILLSLPYFKCLRTCFCTCLRTCFRILFWVLLYLFSNLELIYYKKIYLINCFSCSKYNFILTKNMFWFNINKWNISHEALYLKIYILLYSFLLYF
jgi:hypothetical protein